MPPKAKAKLKKPLQNSKQVVKQAVKHAVKQIVNVRVGDTKASRKVVQRNIAPKLPEPINPLFRQAPINVSLSTQSYNPQAQPSYLNEYNMLLREVTAERRARLENTPPLAPNTTPLTATRQTNEILVRATPVTELSPIVNATAISLAKVVGTETYDDPLTSENMFVGSSRLAEKLSQKLPVTNFDYRDINDYADENEKEQEDLAKTIEEETFRKKEAVSSKKQPSKSESSQGQPSLYIKREDAYNDYIKFIRDMNERYNLEEVPKDRSELPFLSDIKKEIKKIQDRTISKTQLKIPMYKK